MKTKNLSRLGFAAAIILTLVSSSCSKSNDAGQNENEIPDGQHTVLTGVKLTKSTSFGDIITDNNGRSLYFFANDPKGTPNCVGGCLTVWPIFYKENPSIGTGLDAKDFGVVIRSDNSKQTTYKGWPLYYYSQDTQAGDVKGDKVGEVWFVAKSDYTIMVSKAQLVGNDAKNYLPSGVEGTGASEYLTDAYGRTLYLFEPDKKNENTFTSANFSNNGIWPIYTSIAIGSIPSILDSKLFGLTDVTNTATNTKFKQVTYNGHPLYYFGADGTQRGSTKGVSVPNPGMGIWKILNRSTVSN